MENIKLPIALVLVVLSGFGILAIGIYFLGKNQGKW